MTSKKHLTNDIFINNTVLNFNIFTLPKYAVRLTFIYGLFYAFALAAKGHDFWSHTQTHTLHVFVSVRLLNIKGYRYNWTMGTGTAAGGGSGVWSGGRTSTMNYLMRQFMLCYFAIFIPAGSCVNIHFRGVVS